MTLYIDTSNRNQTILRLGSKEIQGAGQAQVLLSLLEHEDLKTVTEIVVNEGPGSYTGLRVGFAIANTLGYLLGVSVNGNVYPDTALPTY